MLIGKMKLFRREGIDWLRSSDRLERNLIKINRRKEGIGGARTEVTLKIKETSKTIFSHLTYAAVSNRVITMD